MTIRFDTRSDAVFIQLDETKKVHESQEVEKGIILDFDGNGVVIGIEVLRVKRRISIEQLREMKFHLTN